MPDVVASEQTPAHNIALPWYTAGFSVVPIQTNGSKAPTRDWTGLQKAAMHIDEVNWTWRPGQTVGVALICGNVSGNVEMTELEGLATDPESMAKVRAECALRNVEGIWDLLLTEGYAEQTPSGGLHLIYRIEDHPVPGNTKLAVRPASDSELKDDERRLKDQNPERIFWRTLAETRGEGGYVIVAPTTGTCHPTGQAWRTVAGQPGVVPMITWAQRQAIHSAIATALDQSPEPPPPPPRREVVITADGELRPGDDFNQRADWDSILVGWSRSHRVGREMFWTRPGKDVKHGHSASTGFDADVDRLYVWSSTTGLPTQTPLTKFAAYTHMHHNGDFSAAAKDLSAKGYGSKPKSQAVGLRSFDIHEGELRVVSPPHGGLDLTDTGSAQRMQTDYGHEYRYSVPEKKWYRFYEGRWQEDRSLWIHQAAEQTARRAQMEAWNHLQEVESQPDPDREDLRKARRLYDKATNGLNDAPLQAAVRRFQTMPGIAVQPEVFDANTNLLNLRNVTLNLDTFEAHRHDPNDMLSQTFAADYDPEAISPHFDRFITEVMPDAETRDYVQRALGYSLLGRPIERAMFLLHGPSGTGKSVLTNVMTRIFGDYGGTAPASTFRMKKNETTIDLHRLRGKRFVATSEMPEGAQLDEELVKRITGGDRITTRGLFEHYQDWSARCVVWIATNYLPRVTSDDDAVWRRAKTIRMSQVYAGSPGDRTEILGLSDLLVTEADGILNWLLEGLRKYKEYGLSEPEGIRRDIEAYRTDSDSVARFIRDAIFDGALSPDDNGKILSRQLMSMYVSYCEEERMEALGGRRLANRLKALGYEPHKAGGASYWKGLSTVATTAIGA